LTTSRLPGERDFKDRLLSALQKNYGSVYDFKFVQLPSATVASATLDSIDSALKAVLNGLPDIDSCYVHIQFDEKGTPFSEKLISTSAVTKV
jgi:hypothetical protein